MCKTVDFPRNGDSGDMLHDWWLRFYVCLCLRDRNCCSAADGNGSCHAPAPSFSKRWHVADMLPQFTLFTFTTSQLMLRRWLRGWRRLPEIVQTTYSQRQKHRQERPGSIEIPQIRKCMPTKSSKASRKTSFCCYQRRRYWQQCALFIPTITRNCFCSHLQKIISRWLLIPPQNRDKYIVEFFVDSIYNKTIDIRRKQILIFYF